MSDNSPVPSATRYIWLRPWMLDRFEQAVVVMLWLALRGRELVSDNPYAFLVVMSEGLIAFFVLIRRPTDQISVQPSAWLLAFTATAAPMLVNPVGHGPAALVPLGVFLMILGLFWQVFAKLILRRSFGIAPANRGIKISGPYRFMRHPMYFGYLLTHIATLVLMPSLWNFAVYALAWSTQISRLLREEDLLALDPTYRDYQQQVRYRLIPGVF